MVKGIPGPWVAFSPILPPGAAIPTCWWNPGIAWIWEWRLSCTCNPSIQQESPFPYIDNTAVYKKWGSEFVSFVPFLLGPTVIYTSSLEVARQVVAGGYQSVWVKPDWAMKDLK
jgi:hypothetical protein